MPQKPVILIATISDNTVSQKVIDILRRKDMRVYTFATDKILDGSSKFTVSVADGESKFSYEDWVVAAKDIGSAWYWRPIVASSHADYKVKTSIEREMRKTMQGVWDTIDDDTWLTAPRHIRYTQNKIVQIKSAYAAGLTSPEVVLTNDWQSITSLGATTVFKMPGIGLIEEEGGIRTLYTKVLHHTTSKKYAKFLPFPGMHQPYIPKKREWRITIVGDTVFSAAIYTTSDAQDDWRLHTGSSKVIFKAVPLPDPTLAAKCRDLMKRLHLRYGAFDFIETPDGEMVFLEVNSNGQYMWLEEELGMPISEAIADELITIASKKV